MKLLCLLAFRSVRAKKLRSLLNVAIIMLSIAAVTVTSGVISVLTELETYGAASELSDALSQELLDLAVKESWQVNAVKTVGAFFNALMILVAAFMIYAAFAAGMRERVKLTAILVTVGASDWQKSTVAVAEALILAAVGIPLGILIGIFPVIAFARRVETVQAIPIQLFALDGFALIKAVGVAVLVILFSCLILIVKTQKRSIVSLAKNLQGIDVSLKKTPLDWIMWRLFGKAGELASASYVNQKRQYRQLSRTFAITASLYVGAGVLMPYLRQIGQPVSAHAMQAEQMMEALQAVVLCVPFLAMLCAVCLFICNFQMRRQEFAVYLSLGMEAGMLYKTVLLEWIYRGFYLLLYSFVGGYVCNFAVYCVLSAVGIARYFINPFDLLLHALLAVVVLCAVMTVLTVIGLRRMNIAEVLREQR